MAITDSKPVVEALDKVRQQIAEACLAAGRQPSDVRLLAVSKTKPVEAIQAAYDAGQREFGENYVQEGVDKITALSNLSDCVWHFIGPLQSNKTRLVAEHFDWVQSLERIKIAKRLDQQRPQDAAPLQVLVQINIDHETSKSGISLDQLDDFLTQLESLKRLKCRGLMAIPMAHASSEQQQESYQALYAAFSRLQQRYPDFDTLSLGMSGDLAAAIAQGSTMVRIGTSIFGKR